MRINKESGFTVLELMVTVVIFTIVAGIAVPAIQSYVANANLRAESESLVRTIAVARSKSATTGNASAIVPIDNNWANGYLLIHDDDGNGLSLADSSFNRREVQNGMSLSLNSGDSSIQFDQDGALIGGATQIFKIFSEDCSVTSHNLVTVFPNGTAITSTEANCQ